MQMYSPSFSPLLGEGQGVRLLSAALSGGSEYADIFIENTNISSMVLQDGKVSQAQQVCLYGAGIRAVSGSETGYAYTMDLSEEALLKAARFAGKAPSPQSFFEEKCFPCESFDKPFFSLPEVQG